MLIPIHTSVRGVIFSCLAISILAIFIINNNSKEKKEYPKIESKIQYLNKEYMDLPNRNKGNYRFLLIENYPYPFQIYEPNSEPTQMTIDDLKVGDLIEIYYYENNSTHKSGINRFAQFIDKDGEPYFVRNSFSKNLGYILLGLLLLTVLGALVAWKYQKLEW
jgi:hypothetical protein